MKLMRCGWKLRKKAVKFIFNQEFFAKLFSPQGQAWTGTHALEKKIYV